MRSALDWRCADRVPAFLIEVDGESAVWLNAGVDINSQLKKKKKLGDLWSFESCETLTPVSAVQLFWPDAANSKTRTNPLHSLLFVIATLSELCSDNLIKIGILIVTYLYVCNFLPAAGVAELLEPVSPLHVPFRLHVSVWLWSLWSPPHMLIQPLLHCSQGVHVFLFQSCIHLSLNTRRPAVPSASHRAFHIFYDAIPVWVFDLQCVCVYVCVLRNLLFHLGWGEPWIIFCSKVHVSLCLSVSRAWNDDGIKSSYYI